MGYTMMVAVLPLTAEDLLQSARWSGAPSALGTLGVAFGSSWIASHMRRRSRRVALALGYFVSTIAAGIAAAGAAAAAFLIMAGAVFFIGAGYAASRLSRYAAADLYAPAQRAAAIGWNVWAATLGSVAGPLTLGATLRAGRAAGVPDVVTPFVVAAAAFAVAALVIYARFSPADAAVASSSAASGIDRASPSGLRLAVISLLVGQIVMVLVMTMTPIHMRHHGHGLESVGLVFAAHTLGMYAFSPIAGWLSDRLGRIPVIVMSCLLLSSAGFLASMSTLTTASLATAQFLLGVGWSFSFVAASALLTESAPPADRVRWQGSADSLVWGTAAVAGVASGLLLSSVGYPTLSRFGGLVALVPLTVAWRRAKPGVVI
jgi:MFS family permease